MGSAGARRVARELERFFEEEKIAGVADLVGTLQFKKEKNEKGHFHGRGAQAIGPYSQAIVANGFAFLSGKFR